MVAPLNANPYFETNATSWAQHNATFVRSTVRSHEGVASGLLTPNGSSAQVWADSEQVTGITAGVRYRVDAWVYCVTARSIFVAIDWYSSTGVFVSSSSVPVALASATWTAVTVNALPPAGAARAAVSIGMTGTPPNTHLLYIDEAMLQKYTQLVALPQTSWPPRMQITATGVGNTFFTINRIVGGQRTAVRGADNVYIYPTADKLVVDAEMPFGVPVSYEIVAGGVVLDTTAPQTLTLTGGNAALTDPVNGLAVEVQVGTIDDLNASVNATVFPIDGINRVVSSRMTQPTTVVEYLTTTLTARDQLRTLLRECTNGVFQQRGPLPAYDADAYYAVMESRERRFSQDGTDPRRITAVVVAETVRWPTAFEARGYSLLDIGDSYAGLTLADLAADFPTLLALAQGDFS